MDASDAENFQPRQRGASHRRLLTISLACGLALIIAVLLDTTVSRFALAHPIDKHSTLMKFMKRPGDYPFTLSLIAILIVVFQKRGLRAAGHIALAGVCGGSLYCILKWTVGRRRPVTGISAFDFDHFSGGWPGFLRAENLSFPSGHVTFAFSTAAVMAIHFPRVRWLCYAVASLVAFERVWENAHYLSDAMAGAIVGIFSAYLIVWIFAAAERKPPPRGFEVTPDVNDDGENSRTRGVLEKAL